MLLSPGRDTAVSLPHLKLRGELFFRALSAMEYHLFVPGELDLKAGSETIQSLSRSLGVAAVSLNIYRNGERVFAGSREIEKSGMNVLVTGVIAEEFIQKEYREWSGYEVRDPRDELEKLLGERNRDVDLLIIVSHLPHRTERKLALAFPFPALFLSVHSGYFHKPAVLGKSIIVSLPDRGRYIGKLTLRGERGDTPTLWRYVLDPAGETAEKERAGNDVKKAPGKGKISSGEGRSEPVVPEISVRFEKILLGEAVPEGEGMKSLLQDYREKIGKLKYDSGGDGSYVGASHCKKCHPERVEHWLSGSHSRAYDTLMARREEMNPDCLICHTTGFRRGGYHPRAPRGQKLEGVGCEECHGPGKGHPEEKLSIPEEKDCRQCHNREDIWNYAGARKKIGCEKE